MYHIFVPDIVLIKFPFLISEAWSGKSTGDTEALFSDDAKAEKKAF